VRGARLFTGKKGEMVKMTPQTESMLKSGIFYIELGLWILGFALLFDASYVAANIFLYALDVQLRPSNGPIQQILPMLGYLLNVSGPLVLVFGIVKKHMNGETFAQPDVHQQRK